MTEIAELIYNGSAVLHGVYDSYGRIDYATVAVLGHPPTDIDPDSELWRQLQADIDAILGTSEADRARAERAEHGTLTIGERQ